MTGRTAPRPVVAALFDAWDSIEALCAGLDSAQWSRPTECPGWTVKDVVSHLIGIEAMMIGRPATSHRAGAAAHVRNPLGEMNEHEVDARRGRPGPEVLDEWREVSAIQRGRLVAADDAWFEAPTATPTGPGTNADFTAIRVLDAWVHEQDIRRGGRRRTRRVRRRRRAGRDGGDAERRLRRARDRPLPRRRRAVDGDGRRGPRGAHRRLAERDGLMPRDAELRALHERDAEIGRAAEARVLRTYGERGGAAGYRWDDSFRRDEQASARLDWVHGPWLRPVRFAYRHLPASLRNLAKRAAS
ncbi:MAG: maleylpyruvate isomerase family mycothiol-dependent enzyme [Actinobacteria bacterium]|nr:maleylpyruvate isomerase family mycothiol-dependent enzyme [Actinomycetota bacterium]